MAEQLLTPTDVTKKLRISRAKFYRIRGQLVANGVQTVVIGGNTKYLESSIDKVILRCAQEGRPMAPLPLENQP
jgi:predicted DNA-binding transcriptional regulator AlpA